MAESLGEKLREAREEREISISEVAEQTRISAIYLEAIERDDYGPLPGGIFNKGFIKSFAKCVGVDEAEALQDYARLAALQEAAEEEGPRKYRPEVLTDDRSGPSLIPTIIFGIVILGLLTWGVMLLVNYLQSPSKPDSSASLASPQTGANANTNGQAVQNTPIPKIDSIKLTIGTSAPELSIQSTVDGKTGSVVVRPGNDWEAEAQDAIKVSYYKGLADTVRITLNGKKLETPVPPESWKNNGFDFEINKDNIRNILESGKIAVDQENSGTPSPEGSESAAG